MQWLWCNKLIFIYCNKLKEENKKKGRTTTSSTSIKDKINIKYQSFNKIYSLTKPPLNKLGIWWKYKQKFYHFFCLRTKLCSFKSFVKFLFWWGLISMRCIILLNSLQEIRVSYHHHFKLNLNSVIMIVSLKNLSFHHQLILTSDFIFLTKEVPPFTTSTSSYKV